MVLITSRSVFQCQHEQKKGTIQPTAVKECRPDLVDGLCKTDAQRDNDTPVGDRSVKSINEQIN